jgi:hypothetical protein
MLRDPPNISFDSANGPSVITMWWWPLERRFRRLAATTPLTTPVSVNDSSFLVTDEVATLERVLLGALCDINLPPSESRVATGQVSFVAQSQPALRRGSVADADVATFH